ncbi:MULTISPECIES: hypothetical protein [Streptomyces]|uniref:hypothetical protein n=1 Tax=Streptomyces sp. SYP-A7185 TaxID=3040076 RepID=UPI0038F6A70D
MSKIARAVPPGGLTVRRIPLLLARISASAVCVAPSLVLGTRPVPLSPHPVRLLPAAPPPAVPARKVAR